MKTNINIVAAKNEIADTAYFAYSCGVALVKTAAGVTKFTWKTLNK
jgi:hypothetical protein